ncbi:MAG: DnaK9 [Candidatus Magnetoglobus multicellularis str. Araruama]|uniref:DnaK9 n=1 Tax=Candidatus Magnetoglobus multicellularis str. Araruama TaxID=890399 RepID=A0A1V1P052_9BACT|nr:MAG: DnaK9 [Candidatus Magnetoglobus multicellularis str. Araruama]
MAIIGIDLGTSNSVVCEYKTGKTQIVKIDGKDTIPSIVFIDGNDVNVGDRARRRVYAHPEQTLCSMKRHIGTGYIKTIQNKKFTPVDSAYYILKYIKENSEQTLGESITHSVITIPAYFNDQQRKDTRIAAEKAGLNVLRLIPEPTAAAIAYGIDKEKDQLILVFDLGGGTFDVSILEVKNNSFTVKAVDGNSLLGGDDLDLAIVEYLNTWIENKTNESVRNFKNVQNKLKDASEKIKIELSQSKSTEIYIPGILKNVDIHIPKFSRNEFKKLIQPILDEIITKTKNVITNAGITMDDINRIVMVGGSSKNPIIQDILKDNFKQPYRADDMDTYVAQGAAIVCASLLSPVEHEDMSLPINIDFSDVIPHTLGVEMIEKYSDRLIFVPILKRNKQYPAKAAVLGERNSINQEVFVIAVFRGEHEIPSKNFQLGELRLKISNKYIGKDMLVHVSCIFELDVDGILSFTAVEIPVDHNNQHEIDQLRNVYLKHQVISYEHMKTLLDQFHFRSEKIVIKGSLL